MSDLLAIENLVCGYRDAVVINGLSLALETGQALALLGRNGTGKTTLIDSLVGVTRRFGGRIVLDGVELTPLPPHRRAAAGIGWVPQERNIFRSLTVEENMSAVAQPGPWTVERVYEMFPRLKERRSNFGNQLSGGEQQMLAIARALMLNPSVILLDEPSEGLAPIVVEEIVNVLRKLKGEGLAVLLIEQNLRVALDLADRHYVLSKGQVCYTGRSDELENNEQVLRDYLSV